MTRRLLVSAALFLTTATFATVGSAAPANSVARTDTPECDNGGPGQSACELGFLGFHCSVTCAEGFYACCRTPFLIPECVCVGNVMGGGD